MGPNGHELNPTQFTRMGLLLDNESGLSLFSDLGSTPSPSVDCIGEEMGVK